MPDSIASVTVTYNRKHLLARQIEALLAQTRSVDEIVIVDSASSDGTGEFLAEHYPHVTVLRMEANLGMAGGWAAGLEYAGLKKKYDWIWTFDDDSLPPPDLLERMVQGAGSLRSDPTVGILAPVGVEPESGIRHYPKVFAPSGDRYGRIGATPPSEVTEEPVWFADMVITSGCMIRRQVVEKIGLPRAEFFMDFFDLEYSLRTRSAGYRIAVIASCEMEHTIGNAAYTQLLGNKRRWVHYPPWREYYLARGISYATFWMPELGIKKIALLKRVVHHLPRLVIHHKNGIAAGVKMIQGILDGMRGRVELRFLP